MSDGQRRTGGSSSDDLFDAAGAPAPAEPGSYGLAAPGYRLPPQTRLGAVRLRVADLDRSLAFYEEALGMRLLEQGAGFAALGTAPAQGSAGAAGALESGRPLVLLEERPGARPVPPRARTGLFHFAILLPDRPSLGRFLAHAAAIGLRLGAGDHLVSESLYLQDPDGLGIEVYADRPRASWRRVGRELMMATDPLDMAGLARDGGASPWSGMPTGTGMGHLHLHVGDLERGAAFYSGALGLDRMVWSYPGALFLAAGGYHHHLGTNVWAGRGASPAPADEAQLLHWTVELPDAASVGAAAESLEAAGAPLRWLDDAPGGEAFETRDPWDTALHVRVAPAPAGRAPAPSPA